MIHPAAGMDRGDFAEPVGLRDLRSRSFLRALPWRQLARR
jgi:hypothetical protein